MIMKQTAFFFTFLMLTSSTLTAVSCSLRSQEPAAQPLATKEWTWLFYDDADFKTDSGSPAFDPLDDKFGSDPTFLEAACSGANLTVIVLQDRANTTGTIWLITENHTKTFLKDLGEVNMGDPTTLADFITYGKTNFPASRYLLSVYDHGGGWRGTCIDETDDGWLTMHDFHTALQEAGSVDLICFTAPCLMSSLEALYEVRDDTDVYVASEEVSGYIVWPYTITDMCTLLNNESGLSTVEVGARIIQSIQENNPRDATLAMSALRTDTVSTVVSSMDTLSRQLLKRWFRSSFKVLSTAVIGGRRVAAEYSEELSDLYNLTERLQGIQAASQVQDVINDTIIAECHGSKKKGNHGVSIFLPINCSSGMLSTYSQRSYDLDFAHDTFWNELLRLFLITRMFFKDK